MSPFLSVGLVLFIQLGLFTLVWALGKRIGKWAIVDPVWSFSIGINASLFAWFTPSETPLRQALIYGLCLLYSFRLGGHLLKRVLEHDEDDPRYVAFAEEWGDNPAPRMWLFFMFQALGSIGLSVPIFVALSYPANEYQAFDFLGIAIGLTAIIGEALADHQLARFKKGASSKQVCDTGLWKYSRHPNYFFQWFFWLSFIPLSLGSSWWWLSLTSPLLMYHFLHNVTGIPPTEKRSLASKGDAYRDYQSRTSAFFPLPPHS